MGNRLVNVDLNQTRFTATTGSDGRFSIDFDLEFAANQETLYQIVASFEGDGTEYAKLVLSRKGI